MKAGIPGIFNSQPWWKASNLYCTIFSVCNMLKNNKNIVFAQCYPWLINYINIHTIYFVLELKWQRFMKRNYLWLLNVSYVKFPQ